MTGKCSNNVTYAMQLNANGQYKVCRYVSEEEKEQAEAEYNNYFV